MLRKGKNQEDWMGRMLRNIRIARKGLGLFGLLVFASGASADLGDVYVCFANKATGFSLSATETWSIREFDVSREEHILKPKANRWEWIKPGETNGVLCPAFDRSGYLQCNYGFGSLVLNKRTMRYIETYTLGYVEGDKKTVNPTITIGECTLIQESSAGL